MTPLPFFPHIKLFFITSPFPELQRRKKVPFYPRPAAAATDAGRLNDFKTKKTLCGRREGGGTRNTKNFDISLFFGGGPFSILMSPVMYLTFLFRELNVCLRVFFSSCPFSWPGCKCRVLYLAKGPFLGGAMPPFFPFPFSLLRDALLSRFQPKDNVPPAV